MHNNGKEKLKKGEMKIYKIDDVIIFINKSYIFQKF